MSNLIFELRGWSFTARSANNLLQDARYAYLNASRCIACDMQVFPGEPVAITNVDFFKVPAHAPLAQIVEAIEGGASLPGAPQFALAAHRSPKGRCGPGRTRSSTPRPKPCGKSGS